MQLNVPPRGWVVAEGEVGRPTFGIAATGITGKKKEQGDEYLLKNSANLQQQNLNCSKRI